MPLRLTPRSIRGLARVQLIELGESIAEQSLIGDRGETPVPLTTSPGADSRCSLVAQDTGGFAAYSNPIWMRINQPGDPAIQ